MPKIKSSKHIALVTLSLAIVVGALFMIMIVQLTR